MSNVDISGMTVVDATTTAGNDLSTEAASITSGELLDVPANTYQWNNAVDWDGQSNCGIRCQPGTVFEVPAATDSFRVFRAVGTGTQDVYLEHLTWDTQGTGNRSAPEMYLAPDDGPMYVGNCTFANDGPTGDPGTDDHGDCILAQPSGTADLLIEGLVAHNNGSIADYSSAARSGIGSFGGDATATITVRFAHLSGFPNNAIYTRSAPVVQIEYSIFENCNVSLSRFSGPDSYARGCTYLIDSDAYDADPDTPGLGDTSGSWNIRGVWNDGTTQFSNQDSGGLIDDCTFIYNSGPGGDFFAQLSTGTTNTFNIQNSQFLLGENLAVRASDDVDVQNCEFVGASGEAGSGASITGSGNCVDSAITQGDMAGVSSTTCSYDPDRAHNDLSGRSPLSSPGYQTGNRQILLLDGNRDAGTSTGPGDWSVVATVPILGLSQSTGTVDGVEASGTVDDGYDVVYYDGDLLSYRTSNDGHVTPVTYNNTLPVEESLSTLQSGVVVRETSGAARRESGAVRR